MRRRWYLPVVAAIGSACFLDGCTALLGEQDLPQLAATEADGAPGDVENGDAPGAADVGGDRTSGGKKDSGAAQDSTVVDSPGADTPEPYDVADLDAASCTYTYAYLAATNGCEVTCQALGVYVIIQTGSSAGFCSFAGPATSCFGCYTEAADGGVTDLWYESPSVACSASNARALGALCGW